jgi:predicted nucleic acid-binding protein
MELATAQLFRAKWTKDIHEEWISNLLKNRSDLTRAQLERTRDLMDRAVMDCVVTGYERLIPNLILPDENDRHVLAAAVRCGADAIVTFNLKDFPEDILAEFEIEAVHPDEFIHHQFGLRSSAVIIAAQRCRARLKNPTKSAAEYLDTLAAQSLPLTTAELSEYLAVI